MMENIGDRQEAGVETGEAAPSQVEAPKEAAADPSTRETIENAVREVKEKQEAGDRKPAEREKPAAAKPAKEARTAKDTAPQAWSGAAKAKWGALDPELKTEIARREREMAQKMGAMDEERGLGRRMRETATPYAESLRSRGGDMLGSFRNFLHADHVLAHGTPQQKAELLQTVFSAYGLDPRQLPQGGAPQNADMAALQREMAQLRAERAQERNYQQRHMQTAMQRDLETFSGNPQALHLNDVRRHMGVLLSSGMARDIQDAYEQAVWSRPDLRATRLQGQQAPAATRQDHARQKAAAARKAGSSLSGSPGKPAAPQPVDRSLREELLANYRAAQQ